MVLQPTNIPPADGGADSPQEVQKPKDSSSRPVAPMPDDGTKKPPFKEVLNKKLLEKELKQPLVKVSDDDDEDDDQVTLLDLVASSSPVRETKPKTSVGDPPEIIKNIEQEGEHAVVVKTDDAIVITLPEAAADIASTKPAGPATVTPKAKILPEEDVKVAVVKDIDTGKPLEKVVVKDKAVDDDETVSVVVSKDETKDKKVEDVAKFKDTDVIALAPQVVVQNVVPVEVQKLADQPQKAREALMQLAQQMVERIEKVMTPGRTDTTLLLNHPPLFKGVSVQITEYDTSQKQFNVTFFDLNNPTARMLVEQPDNQLRLQQALFDQGYTLRMVTIEQKIPGLASTETGDVALRDQARQEGQAGTATDKEDQRSA